LLAPIVESRMHLLIALCLAIVACGSTEPRDGISGTYTLQSVDGKPLPYRQSTGSLVSVYTLYDGALTMEEAGTWRLLETQSVLTESSGEPRQSVEVRGTWSGSGNSLTLVRTGSRPEAGYAATLDGRTLTVSMGLATFLFRR
jgi:hypothetical protein